MSTDIKKLYDAKLLSIEKLLQHATCNNFFSCRTQDEIHKYLLPYKVLDYHDYYLQYILKPFDEKYCTELVLCKTVAKSLCNIKPTFSDKKAKLAKYLAMYNHVHDINIMLWINKLVTPYVPNFIILYAVKRASTTKILDNQIVIYAQDRNDNMLYAYQDYIDEPTLTTCIMYDKISVTQFLDIIYQIIGVLSIAQDVCKFTHYNLTSDNILIKNINKQNICYPFWAIYINVDVLAYIINFDKSYLTIDDELVTYNINNPYKQIFDCLQDIHTLLLSVAQLILSCVYINNNKIKILAICNYLLQYFDDHVYDKYSLYSFFCYMEKKYKHNTKKCTNIVSSYLNNYNFNFDIEQTYIYYNEQLNHITYPNILSICDKAFLTNCNLYYQIAQLDLLDLLDNIKQVIIDTIQKQQTILNTLPSNYATFQIINKIIKLYTNCGIDTKFNY